MKLYDLDLSGNSYKCRLLLSMLGVDHDTVRVDMAKGEHRSPEYLAINPFGQIPTLVDGDNVLRDSQAILVYIARKQGAEDWLPLDAAEMAQVVSWLAFAENEIHHGPTVARAGNKFEVPGIDVPTAQKRAARALKLMDAHLDGRDWLALDRPTIADLACYPYTALAPEGGIDLPPYGHVLDWIRRIEALDGYVPMPGLPCTAA